MGFLDRIEKIARGIGGTVQAPFGLVWDLARGAVTEDPDDIDGIIRSIGHYNKKRGAQAIEQFMGPQGALTATVGALPPAVRQAGGGALVGGASGAAIGSVVPVLGTGAGAVVGGVLGAVRGGNNLVNDIETGYREGISEPVSTVLTAANASFDGSLLNGKTWRDAYKIAQGRSPGQALAYYAFNEDPNDLAYEARFVGTDPWNIVSSVADTLLRFGADPTVVAGKGVMATRAASRLTITTQDDVKRAMTSPAFNRFGESIRGKNAAWIRDTHFANHSHGAPIANVLTEAGDDWQDAMRALMGDQDVLADLATRRADIAGQIDRLVGPQEALARARRALARGEEVDEGILATAEARLKAETDALYPEAQRLARLEANAATMREFPRSSAIAGNELRTGITRSDRYQHSWYTAPLRVSFNMRPQRYLNLHDQSGDVQVSRMLRSAGLPQETQDHYRTAYMAARNAPERQAAAEAAEAASVWHIAREAGMTVKEVEDVLARAAVARQKANGILRSRTYDGEGRSKVSFYDDDLGEWQEVNLPIWFTQEVNALPLVDLDAIKKATTKIGQFRARHPNTDLPEVFLDGFHRAWKASVLLRVGWPIRVVGDEQARIMAKIGTLVQIGKLGGMARRFTVDKVDKTQRRVLKPRGDSLAPLAVADQPKEMSWLDIDGYKLEGAFGAPGDAESLWRNLSSSAASFNKRITGVESKLLKEIREDSGNWASISPDHPDHLPAWTRALNEQIGRDPVGKQLLQGMTPEDAADWLRARPDLLERNPIRARNVDRWTHTMAEQVDAYTMGNPRLADLASRGQVTTDDLLRLAPDQAARPMVHGATLDMARGTGPFMQKLNNFVAAFYDKLGRLPSDTLSRHPFFDHMYGVEATRQVRLLTGGKPGKLTQAQITQIEQNSREYALRETRDLLYDLAEESDLAHMLRFASPFFMAQQEVMTRWAGLTIENPVFVARARQIWNAPEKAGIITDEKGNRVDETGHAVIDGKRVKVDTTERFITIPLPKWAQENVPGLRTVGTVRFNKHGFNMALQGMPGFGPAVQIPVNAIAKDRPDLEESLRFILPYGTTQSTWGAAMPAVGRRLATISAGEEDRAFANAQMRIYYDKVVDYNLGKRATKPTWEEANDETRAFWAMRTAASFVLPAAPGFQSPYQPYIDAYRRRLEADEHMDHEAPGYQSPTEWFLEEFGEEYFPLTQALSRSMDGVPPTLEGFAARKKYKGLIEEFPELGGLIIGSEGAGEFAYAVYAHQFANPVAPGSEHNQRETPSFEEGARSSDVRLGWIKYRQAMDLIDAARIARGLPNYSVKDARDLALARRVVTAQLAQKYPEWAEDHGQFDRGASNRRIEAMRAIANDPKMQHRPDMVGLRQYLQLRDVFGKILASRKSTGFDAAANQDVAAAWETVTATLIERHLAFADLYYRFLERDTPEANQLKEAA